MGITSAVHGAEYLPVRMVKGVLEQLNPSNLSGTVVAVPVCNPLAFARETRITPGEDDVDFANLNRVFPGRRPKAAFGSGKSHATDRTLTEAIAAVITDEILSRIDHLVDFHHHMHHLALVKTIQHKGLEGHQAEITIGACRALGLGLIHEATAGSNTITGHAARMGVSTCVPEIGGGRLSAIAEERCVEVGIRGTQNVMKFLGMVEGEMDLPARQLVFELVPHVRPTVAGYTNCVFKGRIFFDPPGRLVEHGVSLGNWYYLVSRYSPEALFLGEEMGVAVKEGEVLGELFDPYTLGRLETLQSPVDGVLYFTRGSGPVEAGGHAYAVADYQNSRWID
jgi:predicted deacylase